jgi:cutinase
VGATVGAGVGAAAATDPGVGAVRCQAGMGSPFQGVGNLDGPGLGRSVDSDLGPGGSGPSLVAICQHGDVSVRHIARFLGAAMVTIGATLLSAPVPMASAEPCPDVEVVFARGTYEPPGVGATGQAFVDALRSQLGARSLGVYGVNYAASGDFGDRIQFARTVVDGIRDAGVHVESMAANCPNTKMVLGGYSQGAVVAGFVTAAVVPEAVPGEYREYVPNPMPDEVANHVAAVALFGKPSDQFLRDVGAPAIVIGPLYVPKTIDLCAPDDTICNGAPAGMGNFAHALYSVNGMTNEAATFAADRL